MRQLCVWWCVAVFGLGLCLPVQAQELAEPVESPLYGYADLHVHPFAYEAFGGTVFYGRAYGSEEEALGQDWVGTADPETAEAHAKFEFGLNNHTLEQAWDNVDLFHWLTTGHPDKEHPVHGPPTYRDWPSRTSGSHQTMYYKWMRRAWQGGLRLIVVLAINSDDMFGSERNRFPPLGKKLGWTDSGKPGEGRNPTDDMEQLRFQTEEAYRMQDWIAANDPVLIEGEVRPWFQIVLSPDEAEAVIRQGRLAVVLGSEIDYPFNCGSEVKPECTEQDVAAGLDEFEELGIRYLYPIHQKLNAFGGPAINAPISWSTCTKPCDRGEDGEHYFRNPGGEMGHPCDCYGLTDLGRYLLEATRKRGLIVDINHMSRLALDEALDWSDTHRQPLVAGHASILNLQARGSEFDLLLSDIDRMLSHGGMVGFIIGQGGLHTSPGSTLQHECRKTSQSWWQPYHFAKEYGAMADGLGEAEDGSRVGKYTFGTDLNGAASYPAGRSQPGQCPDDYEGAPITYPMALPVNLHPAAGFAEAALPKMPLGQRSVDYNAEGLATIGQMPDFFEDLRVQGVPDGDLESIYRSAMGFVDLWRRVEANRSSEGLRPDN